MVDRMETVLCGCQRCHDERAGEHEHLPVYLQIPGPHCPGWRYACEICGNKRCPHHSNHRFVCTGSNEPAQAGTLSSQP